MKKEKKTVLGNDGKLKNDIYVRPQLKIITLLRITTLSNTIELAELK
ncbi:MAG: hypothetical protein H8E34_05780 [Bacteroidetes bacterium]|nr:hypothetical protein [Bacteroidota bacterium]MBL6943867.1 hypothetical protein [Bacteroidales bacterium]